jgi:hypothetical protein
VIGVVFVHGIRSSSSMWDPFSRLIEDDTQLSDVTVVHFRYATRLMNWNPLKVIPSLNTVADSFKEFLRTEAGSFETLVLVGHSQGGFVIQRCLARMLEEGRGHELARIKQVALFACPNSGSELLLSLRRGFLRRNPQERQLRPFDELMNDVVRVVARDIVHARVVTDRTCPIPFAVYAGEEDRVVTPASARGVFPDAAVLPGTHSSIARPTSPEHRSYTTLKRLLLAAADGDPPNYSAAQLGPAVLEVRHASLPGGTSGRDPGLTAYQPRSHDRALRENLISALQHRLSQLIVLTGESSTGKTRALYEALIEVCPDQPLLRPHSALDLLELLEAGAIGPGSVLWLNDAQRFLYHATGERAAAQLRAILERSTGIIVLATLWTRPDWEELTTHGRRADPHAQARALLTHPALARRIEVPARLSGEDLQAWRTHAASHNDRRLGAALSAGERDGRVIQHLSGGPELLEAYLAGPGERSHFTHREHALLTAALDARRLGHRNPLAYELLAHVADAGLAPEHRAENPEWARGELRGLSTGMRPDTSRTDIRETLRAITEVRQRAGGTVYYEPADYLEQHTRSMHADRLGPPELWKALLEYTPDPDDLDRLAEAAWNRGLRKYAVRLWTKAVLRGSATVGLANLDPQLDPDHQAAAWTAAHASLTDPHAVVVLLRALRDAGADHAMAALLERNPVAHVDVTNPGGVAALLTGLREIDDKQAIDTLLARDPAQLADLTDPYAVAFLIGVLRDVGAGQDADRLAHRAVTHTTVVKPEIIASLLNALREYGALEAAATLLDRDPAAHVELTGPAPVAALLNALRELKADTAIATLLARDPAGRVGLADPDSVATLLKELVETGNREQVERLAGRTAAAADASKLDAVLTLLRAMKLVGAIGALETLAERAAAHMDVNDPSEVAKAAKMLREIEAAAALETLSARAANAGLAAFANHATPYGRDPDGQQAEPWTWHDATNHLHP